VTAAPAFEVRGLCAGYAGRTVLHGLDLTVARGEVVCLLGSNGAGKSTALGAMTGLVQATAGTVAVDGVALQLRSTHRIARRGVAHVPEDRSLFPSLSVREHLRLAGPRAKALEPVDRILEWFPALAVHLDTPVGVLSGGEQQMVALGRALASRPKVLLVDEMSLGLAPIVVASLFDVIGSLAADTGCGVVLVEQHVDLALRVAQRAYVLGRGRVTYAGPADALAADHERLVASYLG